MNWAKYEFSKESEFELQEYLQVVAEKSSNFPVDLDFRGAWKKYLPLDEEIKEKLKLNVSAPIEVIVIEDDDEEDAICKQDENIQTNCKTESEDFSLPEQSFMQLLTNEPKVNVTTTEDLLDTVRELLETEPALPCHIIKQFGSSSLQGQVIEMFNLFAVELNMQCTLKLWKSILESNFLERTDVIQTFLNQILIKKVFTEQDSTLRTLFADTWKRFPEETNALVRVHLVNNNLDSKIFKNNLRSLPDAHKNTLLKSFTEDCAKLQMHQLDTVACLVTSSLDPKHLKMLIELMFSSAKYFENEKSYGKLLLEVVQCLGVSVFQNEQQINYIVQTHKSIFKAQIVKVYNNALQDVKLLSQSLRA